MANEITVSVGLQLAKGGQSFRFNTLNLQRDMAGLAKFSNTQNLSTSEAALELGGDLGTPGWALFRNLSTTVGEIITIGVKPSSTFYPLLKLMPGDVQIVRLDNVAPFAKAAAGTPKLDYTILEE